jgi:hyperosmotically inducible periplasmic protein
MRASRSWILTSIGFLLTLFVGAAWADVSPADKRLLEQGQEKLSRARLGDRVTLLVEGANATLSGTVASVGLKTKAQKEVEKVGGIRGVTNNLRVDANGRSDDAVLGEAIHQIRMYSFYTIFDNVELGVEGGRLKLRGQVTQPWRRKDIENIVSLVAGVKEVENDLEVLPVSPFDDEIRLRVARAIYCDPMLFRYGMRADPTIHVVVQNGRVALTGVVATAMDKVLAEKAARFAATYFELDNRLVVETAMAKAKP